MGFLDKVFGTAGGNDDLRYGNQQANKYFDIGLGQYQDQILKGVDQAEEYLSPYIDQGLDATNIYADAIGINGVDDQQAYFDAFQNDPGLQASLDKALGQTERSAAARGGLFSGRLAQSLFNQAQGAQYGAFTDRLNRLSALSNTGREGASQMGSLRFGANQGIADAKFGVAQQKAAGAKGLAQQIASSRGSGFSGLLNAAGTVAKAFI